MRIDYQAVEQARQEQQTGAVILPNGWYKAKILEVEDKVGSQSKSKNLVVSARVYAAGAVLTDKNATLDEGTPKTTKQRWNINYVLKDGETPNKFGMKTCAALIEATGADVDKNNEVSVDEFEGSKVWVYLGIGKDNTVSVRNEQTGAMEQRTYKAKNEARDFKSKDVEDPTAREPVAGADAAPGGVAAAQQATAAMQAQADAAARAEQPKGGKVHEQPFDDDIPF